MLRFMVASIVTIVFSTVLEWLLYPIDCSVDPPLSAWLGHTLISLTHLSWLGPIASPQ